jgi:hypothetical protein
MRLNPHAKNAFTKYFELSVCPGAPGSSAAKMHFAFFPFGDLGVLAVSFIPAARVQFIFARKFLRRDRAQKNSGWPPLRLPPLFKQFGFSTMRASSAALHLMRQTLLASRRSAIQPRHIHIIFKRASC